MILVTGGAGYIGSHVVKTMADETDEDVIILDNLSTGHRKAIDPRARLIKGDLRDPADVNDVFKTYKINTVIHFAANCYVGESVTDPMKYYDNNVRSAIILLYHMLKYNVRHIVYSSTCSVYGTPDKKFIDEKTQADPINPYGKSKLMVEEIIKDLSKADELNYTILRYFNVAGADHEGYIGEDHTPETHLIPLILKHLLGQSEKIFVYGTDYDTVDGTCIRDYIHVTDLARAHLLAFQALSQNKIKNEVFNLGNEQGYSIKQVIKICEEITNRKPIIEYVQRREGDPARLVASSKKAQRVLGWKPSCKLEDIIQTAWQWHKARPNGFKNS